MNIHWTLCKTYDEAKDFYGSIYLHEWNGKPFYWGKAHNSFFGGSTRQTENGLRMSGRYNPGYRHWIEGCLRHGALLYLGKLSSELVKEIDLVEQFLINNYSSEMNKSIKKNRKTFSITHTGDIPKTLLKKTR